MPLFDARCGVCPAEVEDILVRQGEGLPPCPECGGHLVKRPSLTVTRVRGERSRSGRPMKWSDLSPSDLDSASKAGSAYYDMCRSHGIGRDRAKEISREAGAQTQVSVVESQRAIERKHTAQRNGDPT